MIDDVAAAFEQKNYPKAAHLLKPLLAKSPDEPWVQLYWAKLQEVMGNADVAATAYRRLLQNVANPKLALQARQGLTRLDAAEQTRRQEAIARAEAAEGSSEFGFLVLEPVQGEARKPAAQNLARIMKLDPYTARLQLPTRSWRLYRTGTMSELQIYGEELRYAGIPNFWISLSAIKKIRIFRVQHIQTASPQPTVVCQNETGHLGSLRFNWSEVTRQVRGLLPIFEDVVDVDLWKKLTRKQKTQDYAQVCDLHVPGRHCILRFCDQSYQFQQGVQLDAQKLNGSSGMAQPTTRLRWNRLLNLLDSHLQDMPTSTNFRNFAETALESFDLIETFESHVDLFRKEQTNWDPAFQIYSGLIFLYPSN